MYYNQYSSLLGGILFIAGLVLFGVTLLPYLSTILSLIFSFYLMYKGLEMRGQGPQRMMWRFMSRGGF